MRNRSKGRMLARAVAALVGAGAALALATGPASASLGQCAPGQACLWSSESYKPGYYGIYSTANNMDNIYWISGASGFVGNHAESSAGYGKTCNARFYAGKNQTGHYFDYHRPSIGGTYRDPNHKNGAGWGPYSSENWMDKISSNRWFC